MFVLPDDVRRCAFEMQPREIAGQSAHERLHKREDHDQQTRVHRVEFWFDPRPHHVRKRDAKSAAKHQIRNNAQPRQKNSEAEKKDRQRKPFDAAEVCRDFRLRRGIDRLEKSFTENPVINDRPINKPAEPRGAVDLTAPFRCAGRAEKDQMLEAQQRFRFAVAVLLFAESAQRKPSIMPDDRGRTERDYAIQSAEFASRNRRRRRPCDIRDRTRRRFRRPNDKTPCYNREYVRRLYP